MFEFFFKYSRETFDRGELLFASGWPVWLLVALSIAAAALVALSLARTRQGVGVPKLLALGVLEAAFLVGALVLLWRPALLSQTLKPQENSVAVLLDTSSSMSYGEGERSRLQHAVAALDETALPALTEVFDVDLYAFAADTTELESLSEVPPPGPQTRLGDALLTVLRGAQSGTLGAVVLVSDGGDNSNELDAARIAEIASFGVPVHTVGVGREQLPEDIELEDVTVAPGGLPGSTVSAEVSIRHAQGAQAALKVYDGDAIIASETIDLPNRAGVTTRSVDLDVGEAGVRDLRFTLDPLPGERNLVNNTQLRPMEVSEERRHILYIEGEPRWEYKFIRRAIDDDGSPIRVASLLRTTPNKFYRQGVEAADELDAGFPADEETLFKYDALIIGSYEAASLTPEQHRMIAEFVGRRGGSLLMLGGRRGLADGGWGSTTVAEVLPARLPGLDAPSFIRFPAKAQLTAEGRLSLLTRLERDDAANAAAWAELPELADFQYLDALKPGAVALLEAEIQGGTEPLLVQQHYGLGNAYILATGGTWRWQMQMPHEDLRHETFWRQLLQTLATGAQRPVTLAADRTFYGDESRITLTAEVKDEKFEPARDASVTVSVSDGLGEPVDIDMKRVPGEPGVYRATYEAADPGMYRFDAVAKAGGETLGAARTAVRRADNVAEHFRVEQNRPLLERLAGATGGRYFPLSEVAGITEAVRFSEAGLVERQILDLWDMPIVFLILLLIKGSEWVLRLFWGRL